MGII
ncbi:tonB-dependent Receptor Plug domain protein, partial [Yersinia pestis PY-12]|jgi:hypothetical protein